MKIVTVLGARPQFIKASVVSDVLARPESGIREVLVHTGQHFDANMSEVFLRELGMAEPAFTLDIHGGTHGAMTGRMLTAVEEILLAEQPDAVLVYGDTNSTLAGALAAVKLHVPVAHVEAGLRSFNLAMPEEVNRILTDRISRWLFTPTEAAGANLRNEGTGEHRIVPVGDVMYDVALHHGDRVSACGGLMESLGLAPGGFILTTVHRAENTDDPARLGVILDALEQVALEIDVVWPVHPRTRAALDRFGVRHDARSSLQLIDPVGYLDMVQLEKHAAAIATDSGGVQKEAFFHRVPCVTLRDETEWVELVDAGWNDLSPPTESRVVRDAVLASIGRTGSPVAPYGDGRASVRIVDRLRADLVQ